VSELLPCPFCGSTDIVVREGSTFRWRIAICNECDATCGEIRHNTLADDQSQAEINSTKDAIELWNIRHLAASKAQTVDVWRTIDTAPMDGTSLLLWQDGWVGTGEYSVRYQSWTSEPQDAGDYWHNINPTHWMSMPDRPKDQ
jgi:Lar family restriction alleviation protein